ncbi:MAG: sugar transferase [Sciscionella sp.]
MAEPPVLDPLASLPWTSHRAPRERGALGTVPPFAMIRLLDAIGIVGGVLLGMWLIGRSATAVTGAVLLTLLLVARRPRWRFTLSMLDELPGMVALLGTTTMATSSVLLLAGRPSQASGALLAGGIMTVTLLLSRSVCYLVVRALRRRGVGIVSAIVVGSGRTANQLAHDMTGDPRHGAKFLGFVTEDRPRPDAPWPTLGSVDELGEIVRREKVDVVLVASDGHATEGEHANTMLRAIRALHRERCEVFVAPGPVDFDTPVGKRDTIGVLPLIRLRRAAFRNSSWQLKRVFDITFAAVGLLLSSPLLIAIAIAVRGELGRGVIFSQQRIGQDGKPFVIYKFRSLASVNGDTRWNVGDDPAIGRVGQFIRATGLDELPQLVNVLKGDMSVVGPRPERPFFVERFGKTISGYPDRHRVPVGITGYAAVHGLRGDTSIEERAALDNAYADSWSLWLDLKIVLRTLDQLLPRMRR